MHIGQKRADTILSLSLSRESPFPYLRTSVFRISRGPKNPFLSFPSPKYLHAYCSCTTVHWKTVATQAKKPRLSYLLPSVKMDLVLSWEMKGFPCPPKTLGLKGHRPACVYIHIHRYLQKNLRKFPYTVYPSFADLFLFSPPSTLQSFLNGERGGGEKLSSPFSF